MRRRTRPATITSDAPHRSNGDETVRRIPLADEGATQRLGGDLALALTAGDVVALIGDLGAGKSTLARAAIRTMADDPELEVPSPTYTLVQPYDDDSAGGPSRSLPARRAPTNWANSASRRWRVTASSSSNGRRTGRVGPWPQRR